MGVHLANTIANEGTIKNSNNEIWRQQGRNNNGWHWEREKNNRSFYWTNFKPLLGTFVDPSPHHVRINSCHADVKSLARSWRARVKVAEMIYILSSQICLSFSYFDILFCHIFLKVNGRFQPIIKESEFQPQNFHLERDIAIFFCKLCHMAYIKVFYIELLI